MDDPHEPPSLGPEFMVAECAHGPSAVSRHAAGSRPCPRQKSTHGQRINSVVAVCCPRCVCDRAQHGTVPGTARPRVTMATAVAAHSPTSRQWLYPAFPGAQLIIDTGCSRTLVNSASSRSPAVAARRQPGRREICNAGVHDYCLFLRVSDVTKNGDGGFPVRVPRHHRAAPLPPRCPRKPFICSFTPPAAELYTYMSRHSRNNRYIQDLYRTQVPPKEPHPSPTGPMTLGGGTKAATAW